MTTTTTTRICARCDQPVRPGDGVTVERHVGTGAAPDQLLHREPCRPAVATRRTPA